MNEVLPLSVVITTFNNNRTIEKVLRSIGGWVTDIILVDSGSVDDTLIIGKKYGCRIIQHEWHGYGANKNIGIAHAQNDWILSIDADEEVSPSLKNYFLKEWPSETKNRVYRIRLLNHLGSQIIRHGSWGHVYNWRLFRKSEAKWSLDKVHEVLEYSQPETKEQKLKYPLLHHTATEINSFRKKLDRYAQETAIKYFDSKKRVNVFTPYFSAAFLFIKEYIFLLGFLDGKAGWLIAEARSKSNFDKYMLLLKRYKNQ